MVSVVMKRRSAAPRKSGSKKGSGLSTWPLPAASARLVWTMAASRWRAGMATSSTSASAGSAEVRAVRAVGGAHQLQLGIDGQDVGAEPGPGGQEGDPPRRRLQAEEEHALVDLHDLDPAVLARGAPVRIERDGVQCHEAAHDLAHLAGGAQQPHVGPPVRHDGEIGQVRAADGAHDGHGLAARAPAADADRHARAELADDVVDGGALVGHQVEVSASRFSTKAARCSSATPRTCSS